MNDLENLTQSEELENPDTNQYINTAENTMEVSSDPDGSSTCSPAPADFFRVLAVPALICAILSTFFLYKNDSSITMLFFLVTALGFLRYSMQKLAIPWKRTSWFYVAALLLLGLSDMLTGSRPLILMNNLGIFLLFFCLLLHSFYRDDLWTLGKYLGSMLISLMGSLACIGTPFSDASAYLHENRDGRRSNVLYILLGIALAVPLLFVILMLLSSADVVFASFLRNGFRVNPGSILQILGLFLVFLFLFYCGIRYFYKRTLSEECRPRNRFEPVIAITVLTLICLVYLCFSGIQIVYLFWGKMQLPDGYTYAAYAREGFFQLLFVCLLNLCLVLFVLAFFREHKILKALLALISCCTYIMIASSAFRMLLYIRNYQLTFLRIFVLWSLAVIGILLAGILIQIFKKAFRLFRFGLITVSIAYLLLSFYQPDRLIASYNLSHMEVEASDSREYADYTYLQTLSSDAASIIATQEGAWIQGYLFHLSKNVSTDFRKFNVSRFRAARLFEEGLKTAKTSLDIYVHNDSLNELKNVEAFLDASTMTIRIAAKSGANLDSNSDGTLPVTELTAPLHLTTEDFPDSDQPVELGIYYAISAETGGSTYTDSCYLFPEFGQIYDVYISGSAANGFYIYQTSRF